MDSFVIEYEVPAFSPTLDARPKPLRAEFATDFGPNEVRWLPQNGTLVLGANQRWYVHVSCQGETTADLVDYRFAWALENLSEGGVHTAWVQVQDPASVTTAGAFVPGPAVLRLMARYEKGQVRRVALPNRNVEGDVDYTFQIQIVRAEDIIHAFT